MALLALAYPRLSSEDDELIREYRKVHDLAYVNVVETHWTLVFPGRLGPNGLPSNSAAESTLLSRHIAEVTRRHKPIHFTCRYAMLHADQTSDNYDLFLVPDEGFSEICRLHDDLYSGFMRPFLALSLPYVPHIGIATSEDANHLKEIGDEWNRQRRSIPGLIDEVWLATYDGKKVQDQERFKLQNG